MEPNLTVISLGAGVQSSVLVEMMVEGDLPRVDYVLFADTGDEPLHVYAQVAYLRRRCKSVDVPLIVVKAPGPGLVETFMSGHGRFASMPLYTKDLITGQVAVLRRQCTREYKIDPFNDELRKILFEKGLAKRHLRKTSTAAMQEYTRVQKGVIVECWYGITADEKYRMVAKDKQPWKRVVYPLAFAGMTRAKAIKWLRDHNLPVPKKSSCKQCPYHDDQHWLSMSVDTPDEFEEVCRFDDWLRSDESKHIYFRRKLDGAVYLHRSAVPLRNIDFEALIEQRRTRKANPFQMELIEGTTCKTDGGFSCFS